MKPMGHTTPPLYMVELISYGTPQNVSTLTVLLPFTDLGSANQSLTIFLDNLDSTNKVTLLVDLSHGGLHAVADRQQTAVALPLGEASIELGAPMPYTYIRISAQTDSPSFPTASIRWGVVAGQR